MEAIFLVRGAGGPQLKRNPLGSMPHRPDSLAKAREAFRLANDLMMDLIGGTQVHRTFRLLFANRPPAEPVPTQVDRLCIFHTIITLSKWIEFYDRYLDVIPNDVRDAAKLLKQQVEARGIPEFRNKVAGHIWDKDAKRALTGPEVEQRISAIIGPDLAAYMRWINDPEGVASPTASGIVEQVRDRIGQVHGFSERDLAI